jgi:hypothetical protein
MLIGLADFEEVTDDRIVRFRAGIPRRIVARHLVRFAIRREGIMFQERKKNCIPREANHNEFVGDVHRT